MYEFFSSAIFWVFLILAAVTISMNIVKMKKNKKDKNKEDDK